MLVKYFELLFLFILSLGAIKSVLSHDKYLALKKIDLHSKLNDASKIWVDFWKLNLNKIIKESLNSDIDPIRHRRRMEDIKTMMLEDELMAMLICDICERNNCRLDYCTYCDDQCFKKRSNLFIFVFIC